MVFFLWVLLAVTAGTLATFLYDEEAGLGYRLAQGVPLGLTGLGLTGYVVTAWTGYTGLSRTLLFLIWGMAVFLLARKFGTRFLNASRNWKGWLWILPVALLFGLLYERVLVDQDGALYTGFDNNLGDITFHLGIISGFAFGDSFPPENPEYAGTRLTYPFLMDFLVALALRNGVGLIFGLWAQSMILTLAWIALFYRFTLTITNSRLAAALAPLLALGSGGMGFTKFLMKLRDGPLGQYLLHLPHDYTINVPDAPIRFGNAITVLLVPQRTLLLGLPLAFIVWRLWWLALQEEDEKSARRQMLAAGIIAGFMVLAHAHSYLNTMLLAGGMAFIFMRKRWLWFFVPALAIASPQAFWSTRNAAAKAGSFFAVAFGWDRGETNVLWFWWLNAGFFIPLWLAALVWLAVRKNWRLLLFNLPFAALFVAANVFKLSPWLWDNIKFLFVWYLGCTPVVAWLLSRLPRLLVPPLVGLLIFSGGLDIWRVLVHTNLHGEFDPASRAFARALTKIAPPRSRILTAGSYNNPVELTGRRLVMGYGGHLWSHGVDYTPRENAIRDIYQGAPNAKDQLRELQVDYIVVGPQERGSFPGLNEGFFQANFPIVFSDSGYSLYKAR